MTRNMTNKMTRFIYVHRLPAIHGDPFDRALVCRALAGGMTIGNPDRTIASYPVRTLW
jgi:PIN domain nuclease of toxin-antitoxin system